jgi:hypothetical protein
MRNISNQDFIIWDLKNESLAEPLDVVYHYTTLIEIVNDGFKLRDGHIWLCVASLPVKIQKEISNAIEKTK